MQTIYINKYVLEIPSEKSELSVRQAYLIKKHLLNNASPDYLRLLFILINITRPKVGLYYGWHFLVVPTFWRTWLGWGIMKGLEVFGKNVIVNIIRTEPFEEKLKQILAFLNTQEPELIPPFTRKGIFQPFGRYFEGLTLRQFREAYFSLLQYQHQNNDTDKAQIINETLAWLIAPYWLMYLPIVGIVFRQIFIPNDKPHRWAIRAINGLDDAQKQIFFEYYLANLERIKAVYPKFYQGELEPSTEKPNIIQQYYSLKALTQMRSPNGTLDEAIELSRFTDILDSYETEIYRGEAMKKAMDKIKN